MGKTMYKVVLEWENVDNFNESEFHQNGTELGGVFSSFEGALTNVKTFIKERMSSSHIALQKYNHVTTDRKELEIFKWTECLTDFSDPYIDREITVYIVPFEVDEWTASRIY